MAACARDCLFEVTTATAASAADITLLRSIMKSLRLRFDSAKHSATRGPRPLNKPLWEASAFQRSLPSDLIRGWVPVRAKKTRQRNRLAQRDDEVGAFAGFAALVDAVIGHHDRTAGGQDFCDPRHRLGSDGDAVQRLGGAVWRWQRLGLGWAGQFAARWSAVVLGWSGSLGGLCREAGHR